MAGKSNPKKDVEARRKYAQAFNSTLINIWIDRVRHYDAINTGRLLNSLIATKFVIDSDASVMEFSQEFLDYGIYVDAGTGKETPKGESPDHFSSLTKRRVKKPWLTPRYYRSFCRIKEFLAESFALQAIGVYSTGLDDKSLRASIR